MNKLAAAAVLITAPVFGAPYHAATESSATPASSQERQLSGLRGGT